MSNRQERRQRRFAGDLPGQHQLITSLGHDQLVAGEQMERKYEGIDIDAQPPGVHLWVMACAFRYNPEREGPQIMDMENLLQVSSPGCYICEQVYTPAVAALPCPGSPE